ncbi:hypothetical protein GWK47_024037 [Chionoecetes opilio]|uniref:Uncharacterized protein n=1 Tax=Chionoecetes opilio TaxID=41210 RepID=A0A8J4XLX6_CHIOP|nr:hypothetical protein GWK47_024037 [Chionoecetes opilio]
MARRGPSIYDVLPEVVVERAANIIDLPAPDSQQESLKEEFKHFVEAQVPTHDRDEVDKEMLANYSIIRGNIHHGTSIYKSSLGWRTTLAPYCTSNVPAKNAEGLPVSSRRLTH